MKEPTENVPKVNPVARPLSTRVLSNLRRRVATKQKTTIDKKHHKRR